MYSVLILILVGMYLAQSSYWWGPSNMEATTATLFSHSFLSEENKMEVNHEEWAMDPIWVGLCVLGLPVLAMGVLKLVVIIHMWLPMSKVGSMQRLLSYWDWVATNLLLPLSVAYLCMPPFMKFVMRVMLVNAAMYVTFNTMDGVNIKALSKLVCCELGTLGLVLSSTMMLFGTLKFYSRLKGSPFVSSLVTSLLFSMFYLIFSEYYTLGSRLASSILVSVALCLARNSSSNSFLFTLSVVGTTLLFCSGPDFSSDPFLALMGKVSYAAAPNPVRYGVIKWEGHQEWGTESHELRDELEQEVRSQTGGVKGFSHCRNSLFNYTTKPSGTVWIKVFPPESYHPSGYFSANRPELVTVSEVGVSYTFFQGYSDNPHILDITSNALHSYIKENLISKGLLFTLADGSLYTTRGAMEASSVFFMEDVINSITCANTYIRISHSSAPSSDLRLFLTQKLGAGADFLRGSLDLMYFAKWCGVSSPGALIHGSEGIPVYQDNLMGPMVQQGTIPPSVLAWSIEEVAPLEPAFTDPYSMELSVVLTPCWHSN